MIKLKEILQEKTYKTTLSKSSNWVVYNMSDVLKINPIKVVKSEEEALKWKKKYQQHDKLGAYGAVPVKHWNKYVNAKKLKEGKVGSSYLSKFANYLEHLDQLAQALKYFALKAIPHRKKDINDSLKLIKQLYKKVNSLLKDVKDY